MNNIAPHSAHASGRILMAVVIALMGILACNAPTNSDEQISTPIQTVAVTSTATPAPSVMPPATDSLPLPTPTRAPLDPLVILNTYASLRTVRVHLDAMKFVPTAGGQALTGRQLLEHFLVEKNYDPRASNAAKQDIFAEFAQYTWPYPGAKTHLVNIATGLFAEAHHFNPWSLQEYSAEEIENLFIQDEALSKSEAGLDRGDIPADMPNTKTHFYFMPDEVVTDAHFKQFNLAQHLSAAATTQEQAVLAILGWVTQNFFHAYNPGYSWDVYLDGREPLSSGPVAYPQSIERIYEERVTGCHEPVILMEGMLHSLNIPAIRLAMQGHAVLYLPTLDRYIHGDHMDGYPIAPPATLLLTPDEMRSIAEDSGKMSEIIEQTKYPNPIGTIRLRREEHSLILRTKNLRDRTGSCVKVEEADWTRITTQLSPFSLQYDADTCDLNSNNVPILTLDQLNMPIP